MSVKVMNSGFTKETGVSISPWIWIPGIIILVALVMLLVGQTHQTSTGASDTSFISAADGDPCKHPAGKDLCKALSGFSIIREVNRFTTAEWSTDGKTLHFSIRHSAWFKDRTFIEACQKLIASGTTIEIEVGKWYFAANLDKMVEAAAEVGIVATRIGRIVSFTMP